MLRSDLGGSVGSFSAGNRKWERDGRGFEGVAASQECAWQRCIPEGHVVTMDGALFLGKGTQNKRHW